MSLDYADILEFYVFSGVDSLIEEELYDFELEPVKTIAKQAAVLTFLPPAPKIAGENAVDIALEANNLDELKALILAFEGCSLKKTAKNTVLGVGNTGAKIMIIGDAPDNDEDREGLPFVGTSGDLVTLMLKAIGIMRDEVYLTPFIPWRPPGNRLATLQEISTCLPFLKRQIDLVKPEFLYVFGAPAANALLGMSDTIIKARGKFYDYNGIKLLPTISPATLLKQPLQKKLAWADLLTLKAQL